MYKPYYFGVAFIASLCHGEFKVQNKIKYSKLC